MNDDDLEREEREAEARQDAAEEFDDPFDTDRAEDRYLEGLGWS